MIISKAVNKVNIKVIGAGPTGSIMALALANAGAKVSIFDYKSSLDLQSRNRAYALTHSTRVLFEKINIWDSLIPFLKPFNQLIIEDRESHQNILMDQSLLFIENQNQIGWILDHQDLMNIVLSRLSQTSTISTYFNTSTSIEIEKFDLVIAADGPNSNTRNYLDVDIFQLEYYQSCLTAKVLIRGSMPNVAYEVFRHEGPLAILPMGDDIFQIVWSAPASLCNQRSKLSSSLFLDKLAAILPSHLQPDILMDSPSVFPLKLTIAHKFFKGRVILIGESAHTIHPVGGQGLNLCFRDVHLLLTLITKYQYGFIKLSQIPSLYARSRYLDIFVTAGFTDLIVRFFSNRFYLSIFIRKICISLINKIGFLKRLLLKLMTYGYQNIFSNEF